MKLQTLLFGIMLTTMVTTHKAEIYRPFPEYKKAAIMAFAISSGTSYHIKMKDYHRGTWIPSALLSYIAGYLLFPERHFWLQWKAIGTGTSFGTFCATICRPEKT